MSTRPTVRSPNSAGSAPMTRDKAGLQNTPKAGDAIGKHDAVDPELHIGVIVADMEQAARRGILRDAGRLQQHFLDRLVGALGQRLDVVAANPVGSGADGRVQIAARGIECLGFCRQLTCRDRFGRLPGRLNRCRRRLHHCLVLRRFLFAGYYIDGRQGYVFCAREGDGAGWLDIGAPCLPLSRIDVATFVAASTNTSHLQWSPQERQAVGHHHTRNRRRVMP
jgi:hypothetical protein